MLSTSSFNALLKTLEEPPEHVKFLLATTDPKKVPVTVLSRCLQFQLKNISKERIAAYLAEAMTAEGVQFEPDALELIAKAAQGSMRDALSVTDQAIAFGQGKLTGREVADLLGAVGRDEVAAALNAIESGRAADVVKISAELAERGADFAATLAELLQALHDLAVAKALGQGGAGDGALPGAALSVEAVQLYYQIALLGYRDLRVGPDPKTVFEMTLLRMLAFAPDAASAAAVPPAAPTTPRPAAAPVAAGSAQPRPSQSPAETGGPPPAQLDPQTPVQAPPSTAPPGLGSSLPPDGQVETSAQPDPLAPVQAPPAATPVSPSPDGRAEALAAEWRGLVGRMAEKDPAKVIADRCVLVERADDLYRLRVDQDHSALLADGRDPALERALCGLLGREVRILIETGELPAESAAQHRQRVEGERRSAARRLFEQDPTVRSLLDHFGGRVLNAQYLQTQLRESGGAPQ